MTRLIDLTGRQFGRLSVVARAPDRMTSGGTKVRFWTCRCSCGMTATIAGQRLRDGVTRSCGCLRNEATGARSRARRKEKPGYGAAHQRVWNARGKASLHTCRCGSQAEEWAYDHADPDEIQGRAPSGYRAGEVVAYSGNPDHYIAMCRPCHLKFDRWPDAA